LVYFARFACFAVNAFAVFSADVRRPGYRTVLATLAPERAGENPFSEENRDNAAAKCFMRLSPGQSSGGASQLSSLGPPIVFDPGH
jgi:hypothetical protein